MAVAGEPGVEGDIDQGLTGIDHVLKRPAQAQVLTVPMQSLSSRLMEEPAKVVNGDPRFRGDLAQGQALVQARAEDKFDMSNDIQLLSVDASRPRRRFGPIGGADDCPQQTYHCLFHGKRVGSIVLHDSLKDRPLQQVGAGVGPGVGESEGHFRAVVHTAIKRAHRFTNEISLNAKPIAPVSFSTDLLPQISLPLVVESDNIGVRNEGGLMLMLNLHGGPREDETEMARCARVLKRRVAGMTTKCPDADGPVIENDLIEWTDVSRAHSPC